MKTECKQERKRFTNEENANGRRSCCSLQAVWLKALHALRQGSMRSATLLPVLVKLFNCKEELVS